MAMLVVLHSLMNSYPKQNSSMLVLSSLPASIQSLIAEKRLQAATVKIRNNNYQHDHGLKNYSKKSWNGFEPRPDRTRAVGEP